MSLEGQGEAKIPPALAESGDKEAGDVDHAAQVDASGLKAEADIAWRSGRYREAEALLTAALAAAPAFDAARYGLARALLRQGKCELALTEAEHLLAREPEKVAYLNLKATALARLTRYDAAIEAYRAVLSHAPASARAWVRYGHVLRAVGRSTDCIMAYRQALQCSPTMGEAWWSIADLKTVRFGEADVSAMQSILVTPNLRDEDRTYVRFALGKAMEDNGKYGAAFAHYAAGNAARRAKLRWDSGANHEHVLACERVFTKDFFERRRGAGCQRDDVIFIVGLPRAGSTLIEQILASHSRVEGTMELPDLTMMARYLNGKVPGRNPDRYLSAVAAMSNDELDDLGKAYLRRTTVHRRTKRVRFTDKMPNNFQFVGLIHLVLPNATIIDARRRPMATCFSAWKQHFAAGQNFTYDLAELGQYYAQYVRLMRHFENVLPGKVLRVVHEELVADPEAQVRRILAHCNLPFEPGCMESHLNARPVRTSSSEQVRRPMTADGLDHWQHFEQWLGALSAQLSTTEGDFQARRCH